jgi:hypothetical protein
MLYTFGDQTGPIPLSELDWNFAQIPNQSNVANTVLNPAQANITSVGTMTGLSVAGNVLITGAVTVGSIQATSGNIDTTGGLTATNMYIDNLGSGPSIITGNLQVQGTLTSINSNNISTGTLTITVGNTIVDANRSLLNGAGIIVGATPTGNLVYSYLNNSFQSSLHFTPISNVAGLNLGNVNNYWNTLYASTALFAGNVLAGNLVANTYTAGNVLVTAEISAAGNIYGGSSLAIAGDIAAGGTLSGTGITANSLSVTGTINVVGVIASGNLYAAGLTTGNATMANIVTGNILNSGNITTVGVSATGAIAGDTLSATLVTSTGNVSGTNLRATGLVTATGNVIGGNIRTAGSITATGNVTANNITGLSTVVGGYVSSTGNIVAAGNVAGTYVLGNGSQLTGLSTTATAISNPGGWSITPSGTKLYFNYNGANVGSLDSSGNFIVTGNVTAFGTP